MSNKDEIAALRAEIEKLKPTPMPSEQDIARYRDGLHQAREAAASRGARSFFSRDQLQKMANAVSASDIQDIVRHGFVQSPSQAGSSGQLTKASSNVGLIGSNTGWQEPTPISPPDGVALCDKLMDVADVDFRRERIVEAAQREALLKRAEKPE